MRVDNERSVWLNCCGMPPNLWNITNFQKIGELWGEVVEIDEITSKMESLKCGKIRICTIQLERIDKIALLESESSIRVVEESNPEESYKGRDAQSSANCHGNNNEDDDVEDMEAEVEDYGDMAIGKRIIDRKKGTVDGHNCNSASASIVSETGAKVGTLNSAERRPGLKRSMCVPSLQRSEMSEKRISEVLGSSNGLLRGSSVNDLNRPNINLEVVLDKAHFERSHNGLVIIKSRSLGFGDNPNYGLELNQPNGVITESLPEAQEDYVCETTSQRSCSDDHQEEHEGNTRRKAKKGPR
ncbi:hypothetical protein CsSME_00025437 [Camellia sinensis var. sinensis]